MAEYQAGWYPDPAGDPTKLRYWDGTQWTEHYAVSQEAAQAEVAQVTQSTAQPQAVAQPTMPAQPEATTSANSEVAQPVMPGQTQDANVQVVEAEVIQPAQATPANYAQPTQPHQPIAPQGNSDYSYSNQQFNQNYTQSTQAYAPTGTDKTLRLVAFVFCIIGTVIAAPLIIPLFWAIPMTIYTWGIYKGTRPNSIAFGVCTLLFVSLVGGVLLLISKKDK